MNSNIQTIELTSKKWKLLKIKGLGIIILGFLSMPAYLTFGLWTVWFGAIVIIYSALGAWWTNK